jgi:CRISPR/Cas system-associated exonuclease Cas4 (RecB family)
VSAEPIAVEQVGDDRYYCQGEHRVPSVTTILGRVGDGPGLVVWKMRQAHQCGVNGVAWPDVLAAIDKSAADHGRLVHAVVEDLLNGERVDVEAKVLKQAVDILTWLVDNDHRVQASELRLIGRFYGGTIDLVTSDGESGWLLDIKTGKAVHPHHGAQLAAYLRLMRENGFDFTRPRLGILHSRPRAGVVLHEVDRDQADAMWQAALNWTSIHPIINPRITP